MKVSDGNMLTQAELDEIEKKFEELQGTYSDVGKLLATVKAQRELLKRAKQWISHDPECESIAHGDCDCGYPSELSDEIEQALK